MTVKQLQVKLEGSLATGEVAEAVEWLGREDIRLLAPTERQGMLRYELAHERLIPAIRKLAGKQLSESDKANQLLDRRVNEWLGNERRSRYLLSWREWRRIEHHRPYLIWGGQRAHKEELLQRTRQRWTRYVLLLGGFLCLVGLAMGWWVSPFGRIQQVQWSLEILTINPNSNQNQILAIVDNYALLGEIKRAQSIAERFSDPRSKSLALAAIAEAAANRGEVAKSEELVAQAQREAQRIGDPGAKVYALGAVAVRAQRIGRTLETAKLILQAEHIAKDISEPVAKAYALGAVAVATARAGGTTKSAEERIAQAQLVVDGIGNPAYKAYALGVLVQQAANIGEATKSEEWITRAQYLAEGIVEYSAGQSVKAYALGSVAVAAAKIGEATKSAEWIRHAQRLADLIVGDPDVKTGVFFTVTEASATISDATKDKEWVVQAQRRADVTEDPALKAHTLSVAAQVAARFGETTKSEDLIAQAQRVAGKIQNPYAKEYIMGAVAQAAARLGDWGLAQKSAAFNVDPLFAILQIWRNPDHAVQLPRHEYQ